MDKLTQASRQWATRPDDERFTSLYDMLDQLHYIKLSSRARVLDSRRIEAEPIGAQGMQVQLPDEGMCVAPSHAAFGQLAVRAGAPAGYLRSLPAPMAADCINYGLQIARQGEDVGVLYDNNEGTLRAVTGPKYGRVWNADIIKALTMHVGDGVSGHWRVPGEFGNRVVVTKANTTLYASDRDMFIFLADEDRRIEIPGRRDGRHGTLARGFFLWNSETGDKSLGMGMFLFDYACKNRIVWGAQDYKQITLRHTSGTPERWLSEVMPALESYSQGSTARIESQIADARAAKIGDETAVTEFLAKRFTRGVTDAIKAVHVVEEGRPVETLWDAVTATTAYARGMAHQDDRVAVEREAGKILALAS